MTQYFYALTLVLVMIISPNAWSIEDGTYQTLTEDGRVINLQIQSDVTHEQQILSVEQIAPPFPQIIVYYSIIPAEKSTSSTEFGKLIPIKPSPDHGSYPLGLITNYTVPNYKPNLLKLRNSQNSIFLFSKLYSP